MKKVNLIAMALAAGIFTACGGGQNADDHTETHEHTETHDHGDHADHAHADESHEASSTEVLLDNGEPWEANPETTEGIGNMKTIVTDFTRSGDEDYQALHTKLDREFKNIFALCTMTGEAHNQLHNYLHPMRAWIDDIVENEEERGRSIELLYQRLEEYDEYFYTPA